ncbi:peptide-methionine (S)-S-oxide reductase MsrA [Rhodoferax fermentans]|uniref:peptide-methionine (S)-S-oxide reductase MsrA n=1 Tax=Rhodoferax fermentans TaxID=28066 RepID=UPI000991C5BB|nr:peptide-methionine (S)-S-oxide reductase MsrA [Rhodoferax fermentans]MBK1684785.1 peptide-methionine (S)-S-oxide reductase [Rhodoferax fermentans]
MTPVSSVFYAPQHLLRRRSWHTLANCLLLGAAVWCAGRAQAQSPAPSTPTAAQAVAIFAGGCFWCVEADFDKLPGVISTTSGYTGGKTANPSYEEVSRHTTGHAEAVKIVFDPAKLSYRQLVDHFWHTIDPTTKDRQFCDHGTPYRTAIFALDSAQLAQAQASKAALDKVKPFKEPIVTQILLASEFYPAEDYHQDYYKKNAVRYAFYRSSCGRDARLSKLWGDLAAK